MNRDEALEKSDNALKELAESLRQGKSESLLKYLTMLSRFHRYSFGNCMLIAFQRPTATLVAGFHRWKELHRWVKKDEKGIAILAPMIGRRKRESDEPEQQSAKADCPTDEGAESRVVRGFRIAYVFDVEQTEGKELEQFTTLSGDPGEYLTRLEHIVRDHRIQLDYVDAISGGANGASYGGRIEVVTSLPVAQRFSTLAHELAHELLHRGDRREQTSKTVRETEAESVAYVICRGIGLECSTRASDYIQIWDGDEKVLLQSLELIRKVATDILSRLENALELTSASDTQSGPQPDMSADAPAHSAITPSEEMAVVV